MAEKEVVQEPKQHRMSMNLGWLERITRAAIKERELVTDRAFSEKRTQEDVEEAVIWRALTRYLQDRLEVAKSRE
jgi:hypothetical protein